MLNSKKMETYEEYREFFLSLPLSVLHSQLRNYSDAEQDRIIMMDEEQAAHYLAEYHIYKDKETVFLAGIRGDSDFTNKMFKFRYNNRWN